MKTSDVIMKSLRTAALFIQQNRTVPPTVRLNRAFPLLLSLQSSVCPGALTRMIHLKKYTKRFHV